MLSRAIPPCPDPERYILVQTKEGCFWRLKRGYGTKPATLNEGFARSANAMSITAPAAKRIVHKLRPYLDRMVTGRITVQFSGLLRKHLNKAGVLGYDDFIGFDFQREYPMEKLLVAQVGVERTEDEVGVYIPITHYTVKQHSRLVTNYFFELIVVSGDCTIDNGLRVECVSSEVFAIGETRNNKCSLSLSLIRKPGFAVLKVSCIEGNEMALSPRNYGMKIVAVYN